MRRREAALQGELVALRTRRRQGEQRALASAKAAATLSSHGARLRDDLLSLQRQREQLAEKSRELEQSRLRVRPKDIATLARAQKLLAKSAEGVDEMRRSAQSELDAAQARIDRLAKVQRERLEVSHRRRESLQRELLEGRILREELAGEMGD